MNSQTHEKEWNSVWRQKNALWRIVEVGRRMYNWFSYRILIPYLTPKSSMLELGCGTSTLSLMVAPRISRFVGLDISDEALRLSAENAKQLGVANASFIKGNAANVPFENEFDFVWSSGLLEHFDDPEQVAREHYKAAKPGGTVLISVPYLYSIHYLWYVLTRPRFLRKFWPWTEQTFFDHMALGRIGKNITPHVRVFLLKPRFLGMILLEMRK